MVEQRDLVLQGLITSVVQRPKFNGTGRSTQVVVVAFTTPHDFTGTVTMTLAEWKDPDTRADKIFQAVADLEGPFWTGGGEGE